MSKGDAVMVAVRVRPLNRREMQLNTEVCIDMKGNQVLLTGKMNKNYSFDHCFWSIDPNNPKFASQEAVFNALGGNFLKNSFEGYNGCVLAYGQTGSGKSYTMMGPPQGEEQRGLIPRLCDSLFSRMEQQTKDIPDIASTVVVSYMEIYNEKVRDLFEPRVGQKERKVREHHSLGPYVEGLTKLATTTSAEIERLMLEGNRSRTVAATQMNAESSRSHAVFTIEFRQTEFDASRGVGTEKISRISLVDLAGSERASKTGTTGDRLKEGSNINLALTTLGRVISSLADISSGKKGHQDFVPYRDSVLTWLLKDSLGGNSRTIMIATVSPAKDNYEETLSTLRYADRAKRIVNHAVINEDDNSRIIRELKEELNRLKEMLEGGGAPGGGDVSSSGNELSEKLKDAQNMLEQREQSWSEQLDNTRRLEEERQRIMKEMGISIESAGIQGKTGHFYLVNMNADPSMNELLVYNVKESTIVGRPDNIPPPDIQLRGLSINKQHCKLEVLGTECVISRYGDSVIYVNGKEIFEPTHLYNGYRILLGNNHWFRVNAPGGHANPPEGDGDNDVDITSAKKELAMNDYDVIKNEMEEEKDEAIRKVQNEYESVIQEFRDRLTDAMSVIPEAYNPPSELDSQSLIRLQEVVLYASDLVRTANQYSVALQKDVKFSVTLRISPSYLVPRSRFIPREDITSCVAIRVIFTSKGIDTVWSLDTLHEKLAVIAEMYEEFERNRSEKGERVWWNESMGPDPFCDMENHSLIGVANAYLACLFHFIPVEYSVPIVSPQGKPLGKVNLVIQRLNSLHHDLDNLDELDIPFSTGSSYTDSSISGLHDILPDSKIYIRITIQNAQELPPNLQFVFCQYRMFGLEEVITVASVMEFGQQNSISDGFIPFNHTKTFPVDATEEFIDFCREGVLTIEVLGHRTTAVDFREFNQSTTIDNSNVSERKWARIRSFVSLSAKILELNVEGEHMPVELKESAQSLCGGTYQLKQGQGRKIQISVQNVQSSGRTELGSIQSIEIGSVIVRAKQDVPLDSFQEQDFNIMKERWGQMLLLRKDYLDSEMKILMDKRDKTSEDVERETKLIDEWLQMQQERNVLVHSDFSQMLGMSKNWYLPLGYESRPPIIFIDVENDLVHKTGSILGENDSHMIPLKFKLESSSKLDAIATWDATDHEDKHLMCLTATKDRVFIILRVTVAMKHPPGCKIRLRKRLQLRIVKGWRSGFLGNFQFGRETVRKSGVVYEIFCGLPLTEGVPTRIEPHPSILEPNQGESTVQAFRRGMEEISTHLELNRLRQEISLKEQLTKVGSGHLNPPLSVSPGLHSGISSSPRSQDELESPELDNIPGIVVSPPIHRPDMQPALLPHSTSNSDLFTPPLSNSPVDFPAPNNITDLQTADITPTPNEPDPTPVTLVTAPSIEIPEEEKPLPVIKIRDMMIEVPDPSPTDASRTFTDSDSTESSDILRSPIKSPLNQKHSAPVRKTSGARVPPTFPVKSFPGRPTPDLGAKSRILPRHRISMGAASPAVDFKINDRVLVDLKAGNKVAKVRYIGPFQHAKDKTEIWVGLELTEPIGKNNGTVGTKVYFKCRENHGAFVPLSKVITVCDNK